MSEKLAWQIVIANLDELANFAKEIKKQLTQKPITIHLEGQIGAGKTAFVRLLFKAFGVKEAIKSPTYTLFECYQTKKHQLLHADLYRLSSPFELEYIGLDEMLDEQDVVCIEWPEKGDGMLPIADISLSFVLVDENKRSIKLQAFSEVGKELRLAIENGWRKNVEKQE